MELIRWPCMRHLVVIVSIECKSFKCVGLTWFSIPAFVPKHRVCHPRQVTQHSLESRQATALLRCEPVIPLSSVTSMSRNCLITYLHICYLDAVSTWILSIPGCCTMYNVQCTCLDAVHTWMLYMHAPVRRSQTQSRPSTEADPAVDGESRSTKILF